MNFSCQKDKTLQSINLSIVRGQSSSLMAFTMIILFLLRVYSYVKLILCNSLTEVLSNIPDYE